MALISGFYGFKVGMSQLFDPVTRKVMPVTALQIRPMIVTQMMPTVDGKCVLKLRTVDQSVSNSSSDLVGVEKKGKFCHIKVSAEVAETCAIGKIFSLSDLSFPEGSIVAVSGFSKGTGFQGVMKRHGFAGGPKSHGSNFHRAPGSSGSIRSSGKIIRGKKLPGRTGYDMVTVKGLKVVKFDQQAGCIFLKGAVPGKKNNMIFVSV